MRKRIEEIADVWRKEFEMVMRDQGVLIFFLLVPLLYPILYLVPQLLFPHTLCVDI